MNGRRRAGLMTMALSLASLGAAGPAAHGATTQVLRVGSWHGVPGNEPSLDAAIAALQPGGWLLIGPGDWHPEMDHQPAQAGARYPSAMLVTVPSTHLRGMDRNGVIIDGTKAGSAPCSPRVQDQDFGQVVNGAAQGRNGPEALKTDGVSFENFTVCNFLVGSQGSGNEVWWNGGDDSGVIGLGSWYGSYLSATSTFYDPAKPETAASYGLFVSNSRGPGVMDNTYASNFSDSSYYIGACRDCNATINHGHAENSALGLSSTNSGGHFLVENSEWDENKTGLVANSMNSGDPPSPENGSCLSGTGPLGTSSCDVWTNNSVHDNNNPNVPGAGVAALGPVGTGIVIAGTNDITLSKNRIVDNGAWGVLAVPFPDLGAPSKGNTVPCNGGVAGQSVAGQQVPCLYYSTANIVRDNVFAHNGFFGNPSNADMADDSMQPSNNPSAPGNCYTGNTDGGAPASTWPVLLQTTQGSCGVPVYPDPASAAVLTGQAVCDTALLLPCPSTVITNYPQTTKVVLKALPAQATMPDPCAGVPPNPWCPAAPALAAAPPAALPVSTLPTTGQIPWPVAAGPIVAGGALAVAATRRRRSRLR